jgi:hypothetical protein
MSLLLRLQGYPLQDWMEIPDLYVPLQVFCKRSVADQSQIIFIDKWVETEIFPKVIRRLRMVSDRLDLDFTPISDLCTAFDDRDRRRALSFSPLDDVLCRLNGPALMAHIAPTPESMQLASTVVHCRLAVRVEGKLASLVTRLFGPLSPVRQGPSSSGRSHASRLSRPSAPPSVVTVTHPPPGPVTSLPPAVVSPADERQHQGGVVVTTVDSNGDTLAASVGGDDMFDAVFTQPPDDTLLVEEDDLPADSGHGFLSPSFLLRSRSSALRSLGDRLKTRVVTLLQSPSDVRAPWPQRGAPPIHTPQPAPQLLLQPSSHPRTDASSFPRPDIGARSQSRSQPLSQSVRPSRTTFSRQDSRHSASATPTLLRHDGAGGLSDGSPAADDSGSGADDRRGSSDPRWNSFQRTNFSYRPSRDALLRQ